MTRQIAWSRILAEGTAIVVSILLAFGIQAWWESRQEREEEQEYLAALLADVDEVIAAATRSVEAIERFQAGAQRRIDALQAGGWPSDSLVSVSLQQAGGTTALVASLDAYTDLVTSGGVTAVRDGAVRRSLSRLQYAMDYEAQVGDIVVRTTRMSYGPIIEAEAKRDPSFPLMLQRLEQTGIGVRRSHLARKREVLAAAQRAREAILEALDGG